MIIFPLSWPGKIVLIIIAIVIGCMWHMITWPDKWKWLFDKLRERNNRRLLEQQAKERAKEKMEGPK